MKPITIHALCITVAAFCVPLAHAADPVPGCWDWRFSPLCLDGLKPGEGIGDVGEKPIEIPIELPQQPDKPTTPYIPPTEPTFSTPEPMPLSFVLLGLIAGGVLLGTNGRKGR